MTQSNLLDTQEVSAENTDTKRMFWGTIALSVIITLISVYFLRILFQQPRGAAIVIAIAIFFLIIFTAVTSIVLAIRGRQVLGLQIILAATNILGINAAGLFVGRTLPASLSILLISAVIILWMMPAQLRRRYAAVAGSAFVLMWVLEWLSPPWRVQLSGATLGPGAAVLFIIILAVMLARQAWARSMRNKLLVAFIGLTVISAVGLGVPIITETTRFLEGNMERELTALTIERATLIGEQLNTQINAITTLSLNKGLQRALEAKNDSYEGTTADIQFTLDTRDATWRAADEANNNNNPLVRENLTNSIAGELTQYQQTFPDNVEVFLTDVYGGLAGTTNRTSDYYQADEGWWQAAYNNNEGGVYISEPEYDESADAVGIQIAIPVRNNDGEIIGVLRTTYVVTALETILQNTIGETGSNDLFIPGETTLHIHEGGLEETVPGLFEQLQEARDQGQGMVELDYEGNLSVVTQAPVQTLLGNPTIDNLGWVVAFHQHRDEAFAQINGQIQGVIFIMLIVIAVAVAAAYFLAQLLVRPIIKLTSVAEAVAAGNLDSRAEATAADEIGTLATTFNTMTSRLQETLGGLEQRVADRTRNLELAAEVGRTVSQVQKLDVMLKEASELILKEFDLYYVQVYLTDPSQRKLVLESGTGDVGAQLLARGHNLPLDTGSLNGRAAVDKTSVVISDTAQSSTFRKNPLLPETRGEMAVPLIVGDRVVGVLDMQSNAPGVLTEEILPAFEALAGQMAVAIQNANLLAETEKARAQVETQARRLVREGWNEHLNAIHKPERIGFVFDHNQVTALADMDEIQLPENEKAITASISVTGESLGSLSVEIDDESQREQTNELVAVVARQVAQQIENLRLLESAERYRHEAEQAARLQTVEGWQKYISSRNADSLGYMYDLKEVRPYTNGNGNNKSMFTLPIKARDEMIGNISVEGLTKDNQEEVELANVVAERLSAHIESLRLFEETKQGQVELTKRARQLSAVAEISTASSQELEVDKLLSTVVKLTQRQFELYHAHIFIFDEVAQELKIAACGWQEGDEHEGTNENASIPLDKKQSLVARAARTKKAVIVNDVKSEPGWLANELLPNTAAEMAVPLVIGDRVLGVLDVQADRINAFTDEDANIQTTLASQVATAMQNARSFTTAQKQAERESMLNTINQKIQSATSVEAVLQIAARELGHALGAPMAVAQLSMKDKS